MTTTHAADPGLSTLAPPAPRATRPWPSRWLARACGLLAVLLLACGAWVGWQARDAVLPALSRIEPRLWALGAALTMAGLALRVLRWWWVMAALGHRLPALLQTRVYLAGLALSPTPGKLGETARAALLRPRGTPVAHTLAAFLCDRGSDVIGVALLGAVAGLLASSRLPLLEGPALLVVAATLALAWAGRRGDLAGRLLPRRWTGWTGWAGSAGSAGSVALAEPLRQWARIWRPLPAAGWVVLAAASWALQGLLLALLVAAVHAGPEPAPGLWACMAVYCAATLLGAASGAPSGLGTMDAALVLQLGALGVATPDALAVTVALRLSTLWLSWCIGWLALASFGRGTKGRA